MIYRILILAVIVGSLRAEDRKMKCSTSQIANDFIDFIVGANCAPLKEHMAGCCDTHRECYEAMEMKFRCDLRMCLCLREVTDDNPICSMHAANFCGSVKSDPFTYSEIKARKKAEMKKRKMERWREDEKTEKKLLEELKKANKKKRVKEAQDKRELKWREFKERTEKAKRAEREKKRRQEEGLSEEEKEE